MMCLQWRSEEMEGEVKSMRQYFIAMMCFSLFLHPCIASGILDIPDSADIRKSLVEQWFEAPLDTLRANKIEVRKNRTGQLFQIRMEESEDSFNIYVSPHAELMMDEYAGDAKRTVKLDVFPSDAQGGWRLERNKADGLPVRVCYYFAEDSDVYLQITPINGKAYADLVIFGGYAAKQVPTGLPFRKIYSASLEELQRITKTMLPWGYVQHNVDMYHSTKQMIAVITKRLPDLVYADDAMYDEDDNPVSIMTGKSRALVAAGDKMELSSGGFIKWIADGIVRPIAGSGLRREPLLRQTVQYNPTGRQAHLSESYDLSFALDWTRNIAAAVLSIYMRRDYLYEQSGVDMKDEPFAADNTPFGVKNTYGYIKDTGYSALSIKPLLYVLATKYPGECYLAAVRETDKKITPEIKVFNQCAIMFPYFDQSGRFRCAVFADCKETSLGVFCTKYKDGFIHLTRVKTTDNFHPSKRAYDDGGANESDPSKSIQ